jgi:hypothetical protein
MVFRVAAGARRAAAADRWDRASAGTNVTGRACPGEHTAGAQASAMVRAIAALGIKDKT